MNMSIDALKAKFLPLAVCAPLQPAPVAAPTPAAAPVVAAEPTPAAPASVPVPLAIETVHKTRGTDLDVTVPPERIADAARILDEAGYAIEAIGGVDWIADKRIEIVYDFTDFHTGQRVEVRANVPRDTPELPTISDIYPGANWHERETRDFFGVIFTGHPQMVPLLLPEDATFHPLRKDFGA